MSHISDSCYPAPNLTLLPQHCLIFINNDRPGCLASINRFLVARNLFSNTCNVSFPVSAGMSIVVLWFVTRRRIRRWRQYIPSTYNIGGLTTWTFVIQCSSEWGTKFNFHTTQIATYIHIYVICVVCMRWITYVSPSLLALISGMTH